jgi:hypothetical protein
MRRAGIAGVPIRQPRLSLQGLQPGVVRKHVTLYTQFVIVQARIFPLERYRCRTERDGPAGGVFFIRVIDHRVGTPFRGTIFPACLQRACVEVERELDSNLAKVLA